MKRTLFYLLALTWCLPQTLVGLVIFLVGVCKGGKVKIVNGCFVVLLPNSQGSVSCGIFILLSYSLADFVSGYHKGTLQHEYGHTLQSFILGPFFLLVIGLPSLIWAGCFDKWRTKHNVSYYSFYTEKWANKLGGVER